MTREEVIKRYRNLKARWDKDEDLIRVLPDVYKDICTKLQALECGANYKIVDKTDELKNAIAYVGGQIPRINYKAGNKLINTNNGVSYEEACKVAKEF